MQLAKILLLLGLVHLSLTSFSQNDAIKFWDYSRIAYCNPEGITTVNCGDACRVYRNDLSGLTVIGNDTKQTRSWVGYSQEEDAIVLVFRGTSNLHNWLENIDYFKEDYAGCSGCQVHTGFYENWNNLASRIKERLSQISQDFSTHNIIIVGHSLGGAMATAAAADLHDTYFIRKFYTFGSPRIGNQAFATWFDQINMGDRYRVTHDQDTVPHVPMESMGFYHVDQEVWYQNSSGLQHTICQPGEDPKCSDSIHWLSISDHLDYMDRATDQTTDGYDFATCRGTSNEADIYDEEKYQQSMDFIYHVYSQEFRNRISQSRTQ